MLTLPLDPTDDRANPAFKDAAACAQWLGQLQLTNLHHAHGVLRAQLDEFNRYPMRALERLRTLELLREAVSSIQADYAKKLVAKKLPLSNDELTVFVAIIGLWQGMVTGYQRCLQARMAGDTHLAARGQGALLCQRCLLYSGLQIFEHMRSGYEFDAKLWRQMHELYAFCEEQGWQLIEVADDLNGDTRSASCSATYTKTLLACHAHRADLSRHLLQLLDRWLTLWSPAVAVERTYSSGDAPPLAVDLDSSCGLQLPQLTVPSDHLRYLSMAPLSKLMRVKTILLQQGQSPQQLELGEGCNGAECISFLNYLHQCWCEGHDGRMAERRGATQQAQICYGMDSCYAHIADKPFKQPGGDATMDTLSRKQIAAFGRVLSDTNRHDLAALGLALETWQIEDESIRGARLLREKNTDVRLGPGQLVAVRATDANAFMAGAVIWLKVTRTGQLRVGLRYLPGLPQAIAMKATGVNLTVSEKYVAALLLPAVPALKTPASLIAPRDWFKPGRVVEIVHGDKKKLQLKMELSIEKGSDYERISFTET